MVQRRLVCGYACSPQAGSTPAGDGSAAFAVQQQDKAVERDGLYWTAKFMMDAMASATAADPHWGLQGGLTPLAAVFVAKWRQQVSQCTTRCSAPITPPCTALVVLVGGGLTSLDYDSHPLIQPASVVMALCWPAAAVSLCRRLRVDAAVAQRLLVSMCLYVRGQPVL